MSNLTNAAHAAETAPLVRGAEIEPRRLAYSVDDFCKMTGVSRASVYRWRKQGLLSLAKCGGRTLISCEAIDAWKARIAA